VPIKGLNSKVFEEQLDQEIGQIAININGHKKIINFNVTKLGVYNVVLRIPWLRQYNPDIN
jgi:hypothetical protein